MLIFMEHLLCARDYTRHFTDNNLLDLDSNNYKVYIIIISPFYR